MKTGKMILLLGSVLGVFTILAGCDRVDTSDPNATPKPTATATATSDTIDITDDFSKTDSGWASQSGDDYYGYSEGVFKMHLTGGTTKYFAVPFESKLNADKGYTIQVDVTNSTTENAAVGGLFFNSTGSEGGIFVIDPKNKKYAVQNGWSGLKWLNPKEDGTINQTGVNTLRVEVSGTTVTVLINNKTVESGIGVSKHLGEKVGLYFSSNEDKKTDFTMTYDNFKAQGTEYRSN